ncbi:sialic acid-binding Ig-like lectin 5 [Centroberyx affinis]|uniref:sialic acid-binding Ig-like lectin 5 n=1 Tax=Centroberyx affinis TaxID=166261 RepID=UPI003A5C3635
MAGALRLLLIGCLLQGSLCQTFEAFMPQTIAVLSGSCVTIPCSFNIAERFTSDLDNTCTAIWRIGGDEVFGTSDPTEQQARQRLHGEVTGDLIKKDCTTTLNNMTTDYSGEYFFRLQCQNNLKYTFPDTTVNIVVEAAPPSPTLTPSRLEMKEGSSVSLSCSAAAPCPSLPPTLTWTPRLGKSQETLKENQDKTKVMTSVLTFTASRLHDGQTISCTALYNQQAGSKNLSAAARSTVSILYAPRLPSVSVSPSGLVQAGSAVTLACRSDANPAVKYTWYRVDGDQKLVVGSENNVTLNNIDRKKKGPYMCEAKNAHGEANATVLLDFGSAPEILFSSGCIRTAAQINCSCETVGNPPPTVKWQLDGTPVNHSDKLTIRHEPLNDTGLRSFITMNRAQGKDPSTLVCHSTNSVASVSRQFCVHSLESLQVQGQVLLPFFIATVAVLTAALVCVLVFAIRARKTRHTPPKGQTTDDTGTVAASQAVTNVEGNEVPTMPQEDIYINTKVLRGAEKPNTYTFNNKQNLEASHPGPKPLSSSTTVSETSHTNLPSSEPHDAEGPSKSTEKKNEEGGDVLYSTVIWKNKKPMKKNKGEDSGDAQPAGRSYLEEERCMLGKTGRNCLSKTQEMENLYDELRSKQSAEKPMDCEYAQVKFKTKNTTDY